MSTTMTHTKGLANLTEQHTLLTMLQERVDRGGDSILAERRDGTAFVPVTVDEFVASVDAVAKGLVAMGIKPGDAVGIMAPTRYEWTVIDFATLKIAGLVVPVYHTSSRDQVEWMVSDSQVRFLIVESREQAQLMEPLLESTCLEKILVIDADSDADGALAQLSEAGREANISDAQLAERAASIRYDTVATVCYTSGTTGRPKGAELTHGNLLAHCYHGVADPGLRHVVTPDENGVQKRTLLFLPQSHSYGRFAQMLCVHSGSVMGYAPSTSRLVEDLQEFKPTWLIAVPRVFEKVYNAADARAGSGLKLRIFRWAARVAQTYSMALDTASGPSLKQRWRLRVANRLVFNQLRAAMGGALEVAISGGAALATRHGHFFRGIGVTVMEGYGATETTAPASVNRPGKIKIGTVGAPYPGTSLRISDAGEVQVKGTGVFKGYRNNAEATAAAFTEDGWYRTGDLGSIDADGYLKISGRSKEIIVTAGGKNVQPAVLEGALRSHPLIGEVMVVGEGKPFIGALVALDQQMLASWLRNHGEDSSLSIAEASQNAAVRASIERAIELANEKVSRAESIRKFVIVHREFDEQRGEVSASTKLIRRVVLEHFADEMRELYGE
ncbi:AMP-dependent synthetase/ligase [uncultured Gulosibacter sp.]|uniref:AMP-dependent synthetase/ligase n=1 Tax=uncultured Gulosibacter sp. TaxID=1339167 RepID=UPI00288B2B0B|nr:AMP-dependent synthetase/ligase [uncultured Gulosibacter sp.]